VQKKKQQHYIVLARAARPETDAARHRQNKPNPTAKPAPRAMNPARRAINSSNPVFCFNPSILKAILNKKFILKKDKVHVQLGIHIQLK
ncbi:hypothetical protein A2U01_0052519, partial [Trifolium medium]|nr:hypothetical protein [Trifolium medium]